MNWKFIVSEKPGPHGPLIVVTDKNLLGLIFEQDHLRLDLSKEFYKGVLKNKTEITHLLHNAQHLHLTGKASVTLGIELGLIKGEKVLYVKGIPHAEMVCG